jgi:hypothetical protein
MDHVGSADLDQELEALAAGLEAAVVRSNTSLGSFDQGMTGGTGAAGGLGGSGADGGDDGAAAAAAAGGWRRSSGEAGDARASRGLADVEEGESQGSCDVLEEMERLGQPYYYQQQQEGEEAEEEEEVVVSVRGSTEGVGPHQGYSGGDGGDGALTLAGAEQQQQVEDVGVDAMAARGVTEAEDEFEYGLEGPDDEELQAAAEAAAASVGGLLAARASFHSEGGGGAAEARQAGYFGGGAGSGSSNGGVGNGAAGGSGHGPSSSNGLHVGESGSEELVVELGPAAGVRGASETQAAGGPVGVQWQGRLVGDEEEEELELLSESVEGAEALIAGGGSDGDVEDGNGSSVRGGVGRPDLEESEEEVLEIAETADWGRGRQQQQQQPFGHGQQQRGSLGGSSEGSVF